MTRGLDASWRAWLADNLERRCDPVELATILLRNGFALPAIREAMGVEFPAAALQPELATHADVDHAALAAIPEAALLSLPGCERVATEAAQIFRIPNLIDRRLCDALLALVDPRLRPSGLTIESPDGFRTSTTSDLGALKHAVVREVDAAISRALGLRRAYGEPMQAQRYLKGQEFKPHTDYFEPATEEYRRFAASRGNRTWTLMIWLDDAVEGGATRFVKIGARFAPRSGAALAWNNLTPEGAPNPATLHAGEPVLGGRKTIVTKWFRERGEGAMFRRAVR